MELVVFVLAAAMILVGAVGVIVRSNPVHAALSLILTLFGVAVMFVAQNAHFLAAVQVIVYAGAIVVLFLFVIMLLGVARSEDLSTEPFQVQRPLAAIVGLGLVGLVVVLVGTARRWRTALRAIRGSRGQRSTANSCSRMRSTICCQVSSGSSHSSG